MIPVALNLLRCDLSTKVTEENVFILRRHILNCLGVQCLWYQQLTFKWFSAHTWPPWNGHIHIDRMPKCEQLLHLGGGYTATSHTRLSTFILENVHVQTLGEIPSAMDHFFWLCLWLLLFISLRFCPAPQAVYLLWVRNVCLWRLSHRTQGFRWEARGVASTCFGLADPNRTGPQSKHGR